MTSRKKIWNAYKYGSIYMSAVAAFFHTQWKYTTGRRKEWTEQVKKDLVQFGFKPDLELIKSKKKTTFKISVKRKARELALVCLQEKKESHSKMKNLQYNNLEMQKYLKNDMINVNQAKTLFKVRTRMTKFWENFKGGRPPQTCPVCKDVLSVDTQLHSFNCKVIAEQIKIMGNYNDLFGTEIEAKLAKSIENIMKLREKYLSHQIETHIAQYN